MSSTITPLSDIEREHFSPSIIGKTYCRLCGRNDVKVVEAKPEKEEVFSRYYSENHFPDGGKEFCKGSGQMISK